MHLNSQLLFRKYAPFYFRDYQRVLEVGPDGFPSTYQRLLGNPTLDWQTLDLTDDPRLTYRAADEYTFPMPSGMFDVVVSGQVIEHVRKTWVWMQEVARVCKPGGYVITVNPVSWGYHEAPIDCWRIYPEGMRALYDEAGLSVSECVAESLEPWTQRFPKYLRLVRKVITGGELPASGMPPVVDTITIGRKPHREAA
jgi:SAM-dependent methyltransferase